MRLWHCLFLGILAGLVAHEPLALAVVTPKLAKLMVRINGQEKEIRANEKLELVRGDDLTLLHAVLDGSPKAPDILNFVGYRGEGPRRWKDDDRDIVIPTQLLKKGWSLDKSGQQYKIETKTGSKIHGDIFVQVLTPELKSLRILVKGVEHSLKAGDRLDIHSDDPIQVLDVKTNKPDIDKLVRVEFKEEGSSPGGRVELRILYRTFAFASIYLVTQAANP